MLFGSLLRAWRSRRFLAEVLEDFDRMLQEGEGMFSAVRRHYLEGGAGSQALQELEARDRKINRLEQSIRKRIVQHLSMSPETETIASLVMLEAVKDAERVGDYCKNMLEVGLLLEGTLPDPWLGQLRALFERVAALFPRARQAFLETSEQQAASVLEEGGRIAAESEARLRALSRSDLPANPAVCLTLLFRHLKRVAAHLRHIAGAAGQTVQEID